MLRSAWQYFVQLADHEGDALVFGHPRNRSGVVCTRVSLKEAPWSRLTLADVTKLRDRSVGLVAPRQTFVDPEPSSALDRNARNRFVRQLADRALFACRERRRDVESAQDREWNRADQIVARHRIVRVASSDAGTHASLILLYSRDRRTEPDPLLQAGGERTRQEIIAAPQPVDPLCFGRLAVVAQNRER